MLENVEVDVRRLAMKARWAECSATGPNCCAASDWVRQRTAASRQAVLDYYQQCAVQLTEQLAADEARRPVDVVVQPVLRLDLPEGLQQHPPWLDMCHVCAKHLEKSWLAEENCRVFTASLPEEFQAGVPASAATSQGVEGAVTTDADLPAQEAQQQHQGQQQQQQHGYSDQEQEQWDAASERCLHLHEA